jgi:hypothetical protein
MIGASLDPKQEDVLVSFLRANRDIFAWKPANMPGVPKLAEDTYFMRVDNRITQVPPPQNS